MGEIKTNEPTKGGIPSKQGLYSKIAAHEDKIIKTLLDALDSRNDSLRMGAAKVLLAKILPDIKAVEISGPDGGPLQLRYILDLAGGYIPPMGSFTTAPSGSDTRPTQIQSISVASESTEDNDSADGTSQTSTV